MKKSLTIKLVAVLAAPTFSFTKTDRKSYICESKNSVAYHLKKDCQGLQKCKSEISLVRETTAKSKGLHLCGFED